MEHNNLPELSIYWRNQVNKYHEAVLQLLLIPTSEWDKAIGVLTDHEKQMLESAADSIAMDCAELSAYLEERGAAGCCDSGHDKAMKFSASMRKKMHKALGYK